jgi:hypothetical protein
MRDHNGERGPVPTILGPMDWIYLRFLNGPSIADVWDIYEEATMRAVEVAEDVWEVFFREVWKMIEAYK